MPKHPIDRYIGLRLRQRRTQLGLNQQDLAKAAGVTFQQVQKYENGSNAMNATRLYEFAVFLRVPVAYFFEGFRQSSAFAEAANLTKDAPPSPHSSLSDRESLEIIQAFTLIRNKAVRKQVADLVRAVADETAIVG